MIADLGDATDINGIARYRGGLWAYQSCQGKQPCEILKCFYNAHPKINWSERQLAWYHQYRAELEWVVNCMTAARLIPIDEAPSWLPTLRALIHVGQLAMTPVNEATG